ncbi:MAG: zinc ribbon domain-containing protein, partial [Anaerolineales bacterium]|nr:zinc ribbon domain-containing protein [Anaerolineales bacterium]
MLTCASCGLENLPDRTHCLRCGSQLGRLCAQCGTAVSPDSRFCNQCGARLAPPAEAADAAPQLAGVRALMPPSLADKIRAAMADASGERREVTVLALDLRDLPRRAPAAAGEATADSEAAYLLTDRVMPLLAEIVYQYEGHIDRFGEEGLLALFGAPVAHENDPERAVRAALAMQAQLAALPEVQPGARLGIHTGLVIAGKVGTDWQLEYTVVGDTVNLAARLAAAAVPGVILVSQATHARTRLVFRFERIPQTEETAVPLFRPLGTHKKPERVRGLPGMEAPMIGREDLLAQLRQTLTQVRRQHAPHVVLVTG